MKKHRALKITGIILAVLLLAAAILAASHPRTVVILWDNLTAPTTRMDDGEFSGASYENVQYADVSESEYLHLFVPDAEEPMPLLILVHGGGFVSNDCESRQAQFMYRYFREQGYACATINYRLADEAAAPAALEDVKAAIRFLRANADTYGYDPDRFAIWGESAGGWLAVMAAVTNDEEYNGLPFIGEEDVKEPVSASVSVLLDYYGIIDFVFDKSDYAAQGFPVWMHTLFTNGIGSFDGYDSAPEYWLRKNYDDFTDQDIDESSARYYIAENWEEIKDLQVLICHGTVDISVSPRQSQRLYEAFVTGDYTRDGAFTLDPDTAAGAAAEKDPGDFLSIESEDGRVSLWFLDGLKHADDRCYSDENLAEVKAYLDSVFES